MNRIFTVVCFFVALSTAGADYYVGPGGRDTNPGTQASPRGTLDWCRPAGALKPGDCVYVAGTHKLYLYEGVAGTADAPITFQPWPGKPRPILGGGQQFAIRLWPGVSWVTVKGFEVRNAEYSLASDPAPSVAKPLVGIRLESLDIHDCDHGPRFFQGRTITVLDCKIHDLRVNGLQFRDCIGVDVRRTDVWNVSDGEPPDSSDADCVHTYGGRDFAFNSVRVWGASEDGFDLNSDASFFNCISHSHGGAGLKVWRRDWDGYAPHAVSLTNCLIYNCGFYSPDPKDGNPGIKVSEGAGLTINYCTLYNCHDHGVQVNAPTGGRTAAPVSIRNSIIAVSEGYGIAGRAANVSASDNCIYQCRAGAVTGFTHGGGLLLLSPLLTDPAAGDFLVSPGSPAAGKGFQAISASPTVIITPTTQPAAALSENDVRRIVREEIAASKIIPGGR